MIDARIPLMSQGIDSMKMLADGSQIAQYIQQQRTDGELNRLYQASQGNLTKMLELGQQSKLSRFVMPHLQAQQTAQNKALQDQQQAAADIAKTSSEAYKNTQQGAGYGIDNSSKQMTGINSAVLQGTQTGDKGQILTGLGGLLRTGMINQDTYQYYSQALNNMTPDQVKQWSRGIAFSGAKDPASYLYQTANNVADNAQSDVNNQRTTNASIYSTDVSADTVNKNRDQEQQQFDNKLEYQRQQDEAKNKQGEFKEFGGKVYIVYKDGTYRSAVDANGQHLSSNNTKSQNEQREETQRIQRIDIILPEIEKLLPKATNSYFGTGLDIAGNVLGLSTEGSQATAKLKTLSGQLVSLMPKMSGPQSDKDVAMYREMAGNLSDPTTPVKTRMAALQAIKALNDKYKAQNQPISQSEKSPVDSFEYMP